MTFPTTSKELASTFTRQGGKVCVLYGDPLVFKLSLHMASKAMLAGTPIAVIDGCNRFDVHFLVRLAQQQHRNPEQFLNRIFISRGFTCFQMESAVSEKLPLFLQKNQSKTALIFGLLDTFYDEQAQTQQVEQMLSRVLAVFHRLTKDGISLLLTSMDWNVIPPERNRLFKRVKGFADRVFYLTLNEERKPKLFLED